MAVQKTLVSSGAEAGAPVIVVTGALGALGGALTQLLLSTQHRVVVVGRSGDNFGRLKDEPNALCLELDIADPGAWATALGRIEGEWGAVHGAALCAGGWQGGKPVYETEPATWQSAIQSNLTTAHVSLYGLLGAMRKRGHGSVVVLGSRAVERPWESANAAAYAASKAALVSLVKTAAQELLGQGVRVNAVLPSTLDTAANRASMPQANFTRWVTLSEVNAVIAFLLSDAASGVTGAAIPVYGRL